MLLKYNHHHNRTYYYYIIAPTPHQTMKYQRAAITLATATLICPLKIDALDTMKHAHDDVTKTRRPSSPMYGYCIGCVVALTDTSVNELLPAKTTVASTEKINTIPSIYGGPEHSSSAMKLFIPSTANTHTPSSGEHHNHSTEHNIVQFVHQLNLIMISRAMHNKEQLFLQDLLALSLFLLAVAIGFAWRNKEEEEEHDRESCATDCKFDLISDRLFSDDFFDNIGLTPTIDDDDDDNDEEEHVQEKEEVKDDNDEEEHVKDDASVVAVVDAAEPEWSSRYRGEWQPFPTNHKDEVTEKEEVIIITKPILKNATRSARSILTGSISDNECVSAPKKVKKTVSFQDDVRQDEEEVTSVSSLIKKRKGLKKFKLSLSLGKLCEGKSRD